MPNKPERRNYYRILHVQPEAPHEIIVASYRSLMMKLRHHPDLGGDHETAARINEAYAVLSDPERRRIYDQARRNARHTRVEAPIPIPLPIRDTTCPFCVAPLPQVITIDTRCGACDGPLAPIGDRMRGTRERIGRRTGVRVNKHDSAFIYMRPGSRATAARLRDLSSTGISLYTTVPVDAGATIRVVTDEIDVFASVVKVQVRERIHTVRAKLLTACFLNQAGVFVSMRV